MKEMKLFYLVGVGQDRRRTQTLYTCDFLPTPSKVGVIERYATVIASKAADKGEGDGDENTELQGLLLDMGIANPVTRFSAGSLYHQELAKQLADFLKMGNDLGSRGGMLTLHDAFCLFNR